MGVTRDKNKLAAAKLRSQAEDRLSEKKTELHLAQTTKDVKRLVHELEVHQIELEMQNAELRQAQEALELSRNTYIDLYDFAPVGYFTFNTQGRILEVNLPGAKLLGTERRLLLHQPFTNFIAQATDKGIFSKHREDVFQKRGSPTCEISLKKKDGTIFFANLRSTAKENIDGKTSNIYTTITDISESRRTIEALRESEERFHIVSLSTTDAIWDWDILKDKLEWFGDIDNMLGYKPGKFPRTIKAWEKVIHPDDCDRVMAALGKHLNKRTPYHEEYRVIRKDGDVLYWIDRGIAMYDEKGKAYRMIGACSDITTRKEIEKALQESQKQFRLLVENAPEGIFIQLHGQFAYINKAAMRMFGSPSSNKLIGQSVLKRIHPDYHTIIRDRIRLINEERKENVLMEEKYLKLDGTPFEVEVSAVPFLYENQNGALVFFHDITTRKQIEKALIESEERFRELSILDDLTRLYNSRHFYVQLNNELERSKRYEQPLTLLMLDLDDFKVFNDTYGHIEGNEVLSRLGRVIKRCLRETDIAFRYGGEEFTILLPMTTSTEGAVIAERIRQEFKKESFTPKPDQDVHLTVSIGIGQYEPGEDMKAFVHRVDLLMYQGKKNGKDQVYPAA